VLAAAVPRPRRGSGKFCTVSMWGAPANDELVRVRCYRPGGRLDPAVLSTVGFLA